MEESSSQDLTPSIRRKLMTPYAFPQDFVLVGCDFNCQLSHQEIPTNPFFFVFVYHALYGAEIIPLMRRPISSAHNPPTTDVAKGGSTRTLSVEGVQATRPFFTQPEGRTATDSVPVGRGGPGNSPPLYAAGGAHCNRTLPRDNARQSHARWSSREATMAHSSREETGARRRKPGREENSLKE